MRKSTTYNDRPGVHAFRHIQSHLHHYAVLFKECAVRTYLDVYRLTPAWEPVVPEARDQFLLSERRYPLISAVETASRVHQNAYLSIYVT
jgi:hypothetical protein